MVAVLLMKVSWFRNQPSATTTAAASAAKSEDLRISVLELTIVRGILFKTQILTARFTTKILTSKKALQAIER